MTSSIKIGGALEALGPHRPPAGPQVFSLAPSRAGSGAPRDSACSFAANLGAAPFREKERRHPSVRRNNAKVLRPMLSPLHGYREIPHKYSEPSPTSNVSPRGDAECSRKPSARSGSSSSSQAAIPLRKNNWKHPVTVIAFSSSTTSVRPEHPLLTCGINFKSSFPRFSSPR